MYRGILRAMSGASVLAVSQPALAQASWDSLYGGFFLGATSDARSETEIDGAVGAGTLDYDLDEGFVLGGVLGLSLSPNLRGEVEFSYLGRDVTGVTVSTTLGGTSSDTATGDIDLTFLLLNVWRDFPTRSTWTPYAGGGLGIGRVEGDVIVGGALNGGRGSDTGLAGQLGFGARFPAGASGNWDIGYRFKLVTGAELDLSGGSSFATGSTFSTHSLTAGYTFDF